ncbi:MAG TPA: hypothetical protein VGK25_00700 [Ignavibacteria bacterium]|jgi:hypothetical protein
MNKSKLIKYIILTAFLLFTIKIFAGSLDLENLCKSIYNIYASEEVQAKKEVLVYKKLNELIGQSYTIKITTTDSINYDRKTDMTSVKSEEVYWSDAKTGYFGAFVVATQAGDKLLMTTSPGKEMSVTGKISDILVTQYMKNNVNQKAYTSLKDFDDKGTVIQQVILKLEM